MKKISSILPATSRITNVDLSNGPRRRPGAYSFITESEKQAAEVEAKRLENYLKPNMDKVTLSEEAKRVESEFSKGPMGGVIQTVGHVEEVEPQEAVATKVIQVEDSSKEKPIYKFDKKS